MLTLFFALLVNSMTAHAQLRLSPVEGDFEAKVQVDYTYSAANYPLTGGSSSALPANSKFVRNMGTGEFSYDWSKHFRTWAGLSGGQSTTSVVDNNNLNPTVIVTDTKTNSGLSEGWLGAQYWARRGGLTLVPQGDFVFPFFRVDTTSNNTLIGEGAMRMRGGGWVMGDWDGFTTDIY